MYGKNKDYGDEYALNGLEEEVNYDRFYQKGRSNTKRKWTPRNPGFKEKHKYAQKYAQKCQNNVQKNDRASKIYKNHGYAIEEQQNALIEHIQKQDENIKTEIETRKRDTHLKKIAKFHNDMNRIIRDKVLNGRKKMKTFEKKGKNDEKTWELFKKYEDKFDSGQKFKKNFKKKDHSNNVKKYKKQQRKLKDKKLKKNRHIKRRDKNQMDKHLFIGENEALIGRADSYEERPCILNNEYDMYLYSTECFKDYYETDDDCETDNNNNNNAYYETQQRRDEMDWELFYINENIGGIKNLKYNKTILQQKLQNINKQITTDLLITFNKYEIQKNSSVKIENAIIQIEAQLENKLMKKQKYDKRDDAYFNSHVIPLLY